MNENTKQDCESECPSPDMADDKDRTDKLSQISTNLTLLIETQLVRKERCQADLIDILSVNGIQSLPSFIQELCTDLTAPNFNMVLHILLRKGEFVQNYLKRMNYVLHNIYRGMITFQYQSLYLNVNIEKVMESGLFLTFVTRECSGIRNPPDLLTQNFSS